MKYKNYILIFVFFFCFIIISCTTPQKNSAAADKTSLAILDFDNKTGDKDLDYLSFGLSELIFADLIQSRHISIHKDIAKRSKVQHLLRGSFNKNGNKYLITAQIMNPLSQESIQTFELGFKAFEEIPPLVDKLAKKIKTALNLTPIQIKDDLDEHVGKITTSSPEAFRHYIDGLKNLFDGQEIEAVPFFRKAIEIDPEFATAYWKMGMAFRQQTLASYSKKAAALLQALEFPERLSKRAFLWIQGDYHSMTRYRYAHAIKAYRDLLAYYPDDEKGHYDLGRVYFDIEEWEKAAAQFRRRVDAADESVEPHLILARAYINPGFFRKAQDVLDSYLNTHPENVNILLALALNYRYQGKFDAAHKAVDTAITLHPGVGSCLANKGDIFLYSGDLDKAEAIYQELFQSNKPQFQDIGISRLSELYLLQGKFEKSREFAEQGFQHAQNVGNKGQMRDKLSHWASLDSLMDHPLESLVKLDALWETTLKDEELEWQRFVVYRKGLVFADTGAFDKALGEAQRLKELIEKGLDKKKMRLYLHLIGVIELERKNYLAAIEYLENSLPMICIRSRLNIAVADSLAAAYSGIGNKIKARREYERMPTFPRGRQFYGDLYAKSFYQLGNIYRDMGQKKKAAGNFNQFLEIWKDADLDLPEIRAARQSLKTLNGISGDTHEQKN